MKPIFAISFFLCFLFCFCTNSSNKNKIKENEIDCVINQYDDSIIHEGDSVQHETVHETVVDDDSNITICVLGPNIKPTFDGGNPTDTFAKWIDENLQYPEEAKIAGIQGRVIVRFTISKEGKLTKVSLLRGVHPLLDQEAIRVLKASPDKWTPAMYQANGKSWPESISYVFPVIFKLPEE